jgi:RHS repeat-associated protein
MKTLSPRLSCWLTAAVAALLALLTAIPSQADETITYIHWDALGSPVAATDEDGNVVWREAYRPYGGRINNEPAADSHSRWYTGHPQDDDTGLVYAGARYYDPVIGRFLAIDPVGVKEGNLHSFNRYAYANNNPYGYVDPDGREGVGAAFVMQDEDRFTGAFGTSGSVEQGTQQVVTILETADTVSSVVMPAKGAVSFVGKQAGKFIKKNLAKGTLKGSQNPKVAESAARGRQVHKDYDYGPGFEKEVTLPSGKRADAINWEKREVVELKPNNPNAIRRGERQVEGYRQELEATTGECWSCRVETYD